MDVGNVVYRDVDRRNRSDRNDRGRKHVDYDGDRDTIYWNRNLDDYQ